jgi:RNA polymerase sigma-70 factor (ECF subfamily)
MTSTATRRPEDDLALPPGGLALDARAERDARLARCLAAAAQGDSGAFETFYDATVAYARTLARRVLNGGDTDDLLADAYFEVWRSAARYDPQRGSAVTWLLTIVRSRALDLLRHRTAHPSVAGTDRAAVESAVDAAEEPAERLWRQQAGTRLHAALQRLTAAERWVVGLAYFRELTHTEIAACTGLPLGTVKSHVQRAQTKLRAALAA